MTALLAKTPGALNPLPPVVLPRVQVVPGRHCPACPHGRMKHLEIYGCLDCSCALSIAAFVRRPR